MMFRNITALTLIVLCCAPSVGAAKDDSGPFGTFQPGPIKKLPNAGRPMQQVSFPAIVVWATLKIKLERTACFGTCPAYSVEVSGDGTVRYQGNYFVAVTGKHTGSIRVEAVRSLYDAFVRANFFWTLDEYRANITDLPDTRISISFDGRTKGVIDYAGQSVGMPNEIYDLEKAIDTAAETKKWVKGDERTFPSLEAEEWHFRSPDDDHLELIASAAERGDEDLLTKLLAAGVSAKSRFGCK